MGKPKTFRFESAGWGFCGIVALILLGPMIYLAFTLVQDGTPGTVPVGIGVVFAAVLSAFITWAVNSVLQAVNNRKKVDARKQAKRKKK